MSVVQDTPSAIVAERVRAVLADGGSPTALRGLADALPELALQGRADLSGTFEAARIAGELGTQMASAPVDAPLIFTVSRIAEVLIPWLVAIVAGLALVAVLWQAWRGGGAGGPGRRRRAHAFDAWPTPRSAPAPRRQEEAPPPPWMQAHTLAARGVPVTEIASRTRMPREAIATLLRVRS